MVGAGNQFTWITHLADLADGVTMEQSCLRDTPNIHVPRRARCVAVWLSFASLSLSHSCTEVASNTGSSRRLDMAAWTDNCEVS